MNYRKLHKGELWTRKGRDRILRRWQITSIPTWEKNGGWYCNYKDLIDGKTHGVTNFCGVLTGKEYYGWIRAFPKYVSHFIKLCR